jgi:hypothetical protein
MQPSLLAPVTPFWVKQKQTPVDRSTDAQPRFDALQPSNALSSSMETDLAFDASGSEADAVSAGLDAADVGLRKVQKTVTAILGKLDAAIKAPDRRDELGAAIDTLKDRLRTEIGDAERDGVNWLTLDDGQDPQDKALPSASESDDLSENAPLVLISYGDAADGILTRAYGASEEEDFGGYHLLSGDAASGQDFSSEISVSADTSDDDLKGMRAALAAITTDLGKAGDRLDQTRASGDKSPPQSGDAGQSTDLNNEIDKLLASITRDALKAQALNIMNGDGSGLKRLLAS